MYEGKGLSLFDDELKNSPFDKMKQ